MHPHETMFRAYVEGDASVTDRERVDEHLKACGECRELLSFIQDFSSVAKDTEPGDIAPEEPCYATEAVVAYEHGELDRATALKLRKHMLTCDRCAETYYLIKRMRAPSWTEVVIEAIHSAKESLLRPLEVIGMGELVPLPATITRGESEEPQSTVEISQHITDSGGETDLHLYLEADSRQPGAMVRLLAAIDSRETVWRARLLDADEDELASVPLSDEKQLLHSRLAAGTFIAEVLSNDKVVAQCRLQIR